MGKSVALKVFFDIADKKIGLYRSFKVFESTTFGELIKRIQEKINVAPEREPYYSLVIRYFSPIRLPKQDYTPYVEDRVIDTIEFEELHWPGEIVLLFTDVRRQNERTVETFTGTYTSSRSAKKPGAAIPMTEFFTRSTDTGDTATALLEAINGEIENVCIKRGRLQKIQRGKDVTWRYLVHVSLFYSFT
jgi:hypothetical protein